MEIGTRPIVTRVRTMSKVLDIIEEHGQCEPENNKTHDQIFNEMGQRRKAGA